MRISTSILLCAAAFPSVVMASVQISEVAWMGSESSANHEWIELHNTGDTVDVSNWLLSDGNNLSITLTGTIASGARVVLERTSDDSVKGSAFLVYTGSLVNTGATLRLTNDAGAVVDQVAGGEGWKNIGGDNTEKNTANRSGGRWYTAAPTPGAAPGAEIIPEPETEAESSSSKTVTTPSPSASKTTSAASRRTTASNNRAEDTPLVPLSVAIDAPTTGYVNQPVRFIAAPAGSGKTIRNSLIHTWNFGDGRTGVGVESTHMFTYPGTYVVFLDSQFKDLQVAARHEITILPITMSARRDGDRVLLHNDSLYEVAIAGYSVRGDRVFEFPPHSYVLARQSVRVPGLWNSDVTVHDARGALVTTTAVSPQVSASTTATTTQTTKPEMEESVELFATTTALSSLDADADDIQPRLALAGDTQFGFATVATPAPAALQVKSDATTTTTSSELVATVVTPRSTSTQVTSVIAAATPGETRQWWLLGLVGLLGVSVVSIYARPTRQ